MSYGGGQLVHSRPGPPWPKAFRARELGQTRAMAYTRGDDIWVHGAGLNGDGAELKGLAILGPGWRRAIAKGTFLRQNARGGVQVKFPSGNCLAWPGLAWGMAWRRLAWPGLAWPGVA